MLIVFSGLPGTGKTTLAKALAADLQAVYLRIDSIEQALRNSGALRQDVDASGYQVANAIALDKPQGGPPCDRRLRQPGRAKPPGLG